MCNSEPSRLGFLMETWKDEAEKTAMAEAENKKLALAMLERLISLGVDTLRQAGQANQALKVILDELDRIERRDQRPEGRQLNTPASID